MRYVPRQSIAKAAIAPVATASSEGHPGTADLTVQRSVVAAEQVSETPVVEVFRPVESMVGLAGAARVGSEQQEAALQAEEPADRSVREVSALRRYFPAAESVVQRLERELRQG